MLASFTDILDSAVLLAQGLKLTFWGISVADLTTDCIELIPSHHDHRL